MLCCTYLLRDQSSKEGLAMGWVPAPAVRARRQQHLRPIFAVLEERGVQRVWLGRQLRIPRRRLWTYEHGYCRIPADFIDVEE